MILKAFSLYDTKVGHFNVPFFMSHLVQAQRACIDLGMDRTTIVGRHPSDYALIEVGHFDDGTGVLTPCNPINHGLISGFLPTARQAALFEPDPNYVQEA